MIKFNGLDHFFIKVYRHKSKPVDVEKASNLIIENYNDPNFKSDDLLSQSLSVIMPFIDIDKDIKALGAAAIVLAAHDRKSKDLYTPEMGARFLYDFSKALKEIADEGNESVYSDVYFENERRYLYSPDDTESFPGMEVYTYKSTSYDEDYDYDGYDEEEYEGGYEGGSDYYSNYFPKPDIYEIKYERPPSYIPGAQYKNNVASDTIFAKILNPMNYRSEDHDIFREISLKAQQLGYGSDTYVHFPTLTEKDLEASQKLIDIIKTNKPDTVLQIANGQKDDLTKNLLISLTMMNFNESDIDNIQLKKSIARVYADREAGIPINEEKLSLRIISDIVSQNKAKDFYESIPLETHLSKIKDLSSNKAKKVRNYFNNPYNSIKFEDAKYQVSGDFDKLSRNASFIIRRDIVNGNNISPDFLAQFHKILISNKITLSEKGNNDLLKDDDQKIAAYNIINKKVNINKPHGFNASLRDDPIIKKFLMKQEAEFLIYKEERRLYRQRRAKKLIQQRIDNALEKQQRILEKEKIKLEKERIKSEKEKIKLEKETGKYKDPNSPFIEPDEAAEIDRNARARVLASSRSSSWPFIDM